MTLPSERGPWAGRDPIALLHELELHQVELEVQNAELQAANHELRRANAALATSRDRFRALYELAPVPYVTVDAGRSIVDLNHAATLVLDATRTRLIGGAIDAFVDDAGRARFREFLHGVFHAGPARCGDVVLGRADGVQVEVQIDGVLLRESADDPPRCVLAIVDITARKRAELARRRAQDEVLAIVSHDLRGPLNTIGLACDALAGDLPPASQRTYLATIERASARCERLIKDLLGLAKIEHGLELDVTIFDLHELVRHVCHDHTPAAVAAGATLTLSIDDTTQPVAGDRDRVHQIVSNLIRNALVHAPGAAIEVRVTARDADVLITVADDGPGIAPDDLVHVFERYRQGKHRRGGTGLGLAIVRTFAEAHHGTVAVTSQLGRGTRFEVVLPGGPPPLEPRS